MQERSCSAHSFPSLEDYYRDLSLAADDKWRNLDELIAGHGVVLRIPVLQVTSGKVSIPLLAVAARDAALPEFGSRYAWVPSRGVMVTCGMWRAP